MSASYGRIPRGRSSTRNHSCPICASHAHASFRRSRKEIAGDNLHTPILLSRSNSDGSAFVSTASLSPCIETNPIPLAGGDFAASGNTSDGSLQLSASTRCRQSLILDSWTTQQAQERIMTMERQENEAELAALSHTQPVSALGSTFLRVPSPVRSESSVDIPGVRASSLVQMWKEIEASASSRANVTSNAGSEISTEDCVAAQESMTSWESDHTATSEPRSSLWASDCGDSERGRVADTIRRLSSANRAQSSASSCSDDIEREHAFAREASHPEHSVLENVRFQVLSKNPARFRRPQLVQDLLARIRQERRNELARMVDRRPVSRFSHRRPIQALLKFKLLQWNVIARGQHLPTSTAVGLDQLQTGTSILLSSSSGGRSVESDVVLPICETTNSSDDLSTGLASSIWESFNHRSEQDNHSATTTNSSNNLSSPCQNSLLDSQQSASTEEIESEAQQFQETDVRHEGGLPRLILLPEVSEEMREGASRRSDLPCQDTGLEAENLNCPGAANILPSLPSRESDVAMAEVVDESQQNSVGWSPDDFNQGRPGDNSHRQSDAWLDDISDNVEIRELFERRRVTITLASDFRDRMNSLILSFLQRQVYRTTDDGYSVAEEEQGSVVHLQNQETGTTDPVASTSLQLPLATYSDDRQGSFQISSFTRHPSRSPEMELMSDLKGDMARLRQEMSELKKSIDSCVQMQVELQHFIKREFLPSTGHLGGSYGEALQSSNQVPLKRGRCCICYEMQVDSLIYKCGHMCTCFKCAQELQSGSRKCPFCRAQIIDVARAYSDP